MLARHLSVLSAHSGFVLQRQHLDVGSVRYDVDVKGLSLLLSLVVWLGGILQPSSVLHGDLVTCLWRWAVALLKNVLRNTHDCVCV